ncbi:mitochondrial large subunit ribosomal protein-domain-containing protein [Lineolata rhizophorae]|uniref:Large ribosomal subunit protein mL49 n=1 Tax=Lineolata rhizophorae TaxID=578093 RepID=A0A6A6P679_9PEZI|nr:mitochondrial large subunit ribosomal protein-domain-containing protein [Lineolata rhizophorae]
MASSTPILSFLRPLALPRRATLRQFQAFSTASRLRNIAGATEAQSAPTPPTESPKSASTTTSPRPSPYPSKSRYHVARTHSGNLPVYRDWKRGGNLHLTIVRKITGDPHALRNDLRQYIGLEDEDAWVNSITKQVILSGFHVEQVHEFLKGKNF